MTEDELNAVLDRLCLKRFGKTYATDPAPPTGKPSAAAADTPDAPGHGDGPDSLARIRRDFPDIFLPRTPDPSA